VTKKERVLLLYPPADQGYTCDYLPFTPLALHCLKSYLERHANCAVSVFNCTNADFDQISALISSQKPDLVGVSSLLISHGMSLRLLEYSKQLGAMTILGGHNATNLAVQILKNRPYIDYVVRGDGEASLLGLVNGEDPVSIPNVVRRSGNEIVFNSLVQLDLNELPLPFIDQPELGWHPYLSHKGCLKRELEGPCVFCGRADKDFRLKKPKQFVDELIYLFDQHNCRVLFDVGDDILSSLPWLEEAAELMPERVSSQLSIIAFANVRNISPKTVSHLRRLGFRKLVFGLESGDIAVLKKCNKASDPQEALARLELCLRAGFSVSAAYVLGLPGENTRSLKNTLDHAQRVWELVQKYNRENLSAVTANIIEPLPGSVVYRGLHKAFPEKYGSRDFLQIDELQRDYFSLFFRLKDRAAVDGFRAQLRDTADKVNCATPISTPMGIQHKPSVELGVN
jgi:anaerobic magnesium-protoporphyrin IX monomethyl ester cyclase